MRFTIEGRLPSLNDYVKANRNNFKYGNIMRQEYEDKVYFAIKKYKLNKVESYPVRINIIWYEKNRLRDIDNITWAVKFILDPLVRTGILENDSQAYISHIENAVKVDKKNPRIEVEIIESKPF